MRRALKIVGFTLLGVVLLLPVAVYMPAVQRFALHKAVAAIEKSTGWEISVGGLRIKPPLKLSVADVSVTGGDTLQIRVKSLTAQARIGAFLRGGVIDIPSAALEEAYVRLSIPAADTTDTVAGRPWKIRMGELDLKEVSCDLVLGGDTISAGIPSGKVSAAWIDTGLPDIEVEKVVIDGGRAAMASGLGTLPGGFDMGHIVLDSIALLLDSFDMKGAVIAGNLVRLGLREKSGLRLELTGRARMDTASVVLRGLVIKTAASHLEADGVVGLGGAQSEAAVTAALDVDELSPFLPPDSKALKGRTVSIGLQARGTIDQIDVEQCNITVPGVAAAHLKGQLAHPADMKNITGNLTVDARVSDPSPIRKYLPEGVRIPPGTALTGTLAAVRGEFRPDLVVAAAGGRVKVKGEWHPPMKRYQADIQAVNFDLQAFLPGNPVGRVDLDIKAGGAGYDPYSPSTSLRAEAALRRVGLPGYVYGPAELRAEYAGNHLKAWLDSRDTALVGRLTVDGVLLRDSLRAEVRGNIEQLDLRRPGLAGDTMVMGLRLHTVASRGRQGDLALWLRTDSVVVATPNHSDSVPSMTLTAFARRDTMGVHAVSGDLKLDAAVGSGLDSIGGVVSRVMQELNEQLAQQRIAAGRLLEPVPPLSLKLTAQQDNPLRKFLALRHIGFWTLDLDVENNGNRPLIQGLVTAFQRGDLTFDTVRLAASTRGDSLLAALGLRNLPTHGSPHLAAVDARVSAAGNTAWVEMMQQNSTGKKGIDMALTATAEDSSTYTFRFAHPDLVAGYTRWRADRGDYVTLRPGTTPEARLMLTSGRQSISATNLDAGGQLSDSIRLVLKNINVAQAAAPFTDDIPVEALLSLDGAMSLASGSMGGSLKMALDSLSYMGRKLGDIALTARYAGDTAQNHRLLTRMAIGGREALTARGVLSSKPGGAIDLSAGIDSLPLPVLNSFLAAAGISLTGSVTGKLDATGTLDRIVVDGQVDLSKAQVHADKAGAGFGFDPRPLTVQNSVVRFDKYKIFASDRSFATLDGTADISDPGDILIDAALKADRFRAVDVARRSDLLVFGKADLKMGLTAKGPLSTLKVRGSAGLLGGTDLVYILPDSPLGGTIDRSNVVTFMLFADTIQRYLPKAVKTKKASTLDLIAGLSIDEQVDLSLYLNADGQDRIEARGGGDLVFALDPHGQTRLTGKYTLRGGTVNYSPPVITEKNFSITPGGSVTWTGEVGNPTLDIEAKDRVHSSVSSDAEGSRSVVFDIIIRVKNTLERLAILLDLEAPEDVTIQNQLASFTPDQRSSQAMNMLIYNTYTGPGTTAKVSTATPVNAFIEKELNQWAQSALKNFDLSFGIDTYDQTGLDGENTRTDYSYKISKNLFDNRVRIDVGGRYTTGTQPGESSTENLVDDLTIEYTVGKKNNMFVKVFRHQGYENVVEGEVTRQGVGFATRRKVDNFWDMFRSKKAIARRNAAKTEGK